ncbi:unnamed protein product [Fusarium graminearum]|nr:unnamed protein product [Fusarium graminearum]
MRKEKRVDGKRNQNLTCLGDGLLIAAAAATATVEGLAAVITGDFPFTVLVEGTDRGDSTRSLVTEAESGAAVAVAVAVASAAAAAAATTVDDDDGSGDRSMDGVAA